jgi:hypothetical protein
MMMMSVANIPNNSFNTINKYKSNAAAAGYKTPEPKHETGLQVDRQKSLINLLAANNGEFFRKAAGDDGVLSVAEAAVLLTDKSPLKDNKAISKFAGEFHSLNSNFRNLVLAKTDETGYEDQKFAGMTLGDIEAIQERFIELDGKNYETADANQEKGFAHLGQEYARKALASKEFTEEVSISEENFNTGEGLTNVLNGKLSSAERAGTKEETQKSEANNSKPKAEAKGGTNWWALGGVALVGTLAAVLFGQKK